MQTVNTGKLIWGELTVYSRKGNEKNYYRPQHSYGKVMFSQTCQEFCPQGGCLPQCMLEYTPPWSDIPPSQTPRWSDTPRRSLQRAVRILLECILVYKSFCAVPWARKLIISSDKLYHA